jgi:hypothetical protein
VEHGLSCKKGGFVGQRHDDVCEELAHLCSMALTPSRISSEPEIFYGRELNAAQRNANEVLGDGRRWRSMAATAMAGVVDGSGS